jgi:hypothetical protein
MSSWRMSSWRMSSWRMSSGRISMVAIGAVAWATAGCSNLRVARTLDARQVAAQISESIAATFTVAKPAVHCPGGIKAQTGVTFDCGALLENQPLTIHVRVDDSRGLYTPTLGQAVVVVAKIAAVIRSAPAQANQSTVACGDHTLLVKRPGDSFACTVTSGGVTRTVNLTVQDLNGTVTYAQSPAPTPPGGPPASG